MLCVCLKIAANALKTLFSAKHHLASTNVCLLFTLGCKSTQNSKVNNHSGINRNCLVESLSEVYTDSNTLIANKRLQ